MNTLFLSDLHLEDRRPEVAGWLWTFLDGPARAADAVYILGDLFEYWIGDDAVPPLAVELARRTAALVDRGIPFYFQHGNRDFLLSVDFANRSGMQLLPEAVVVDLYGTPTLLMHGDSLCTDDIEYQAFRRQSRDPAWQTVILSKSVDERIAIARGARDASAQHKDGSNLSIMDVNQSAVERAFTEHGVSRLIHGHTHRPAVHRHALPGGATATRYVLADWYERGSYLEVSPDGVRSLEVEP
jgi:UDP-2,3-diacylglucosamine hydrolase